MSRQYTLGKNERLKSRKQIDLLFKQGKSIPVFPFRVYYVLEPADGQENLAEMLRFGVGVSSRNFKKAVHRNRIKRLIREAYRLGKNEVSELLKKKNFKGTLFFIYTAKDLPDFSLIKEKTTLVLNKIIKIIHENSAADS